MIVACIDMCRRNRALKRKILQIEGNWRGSPSTQDTSDSGYDIPWRNIPKNELQFTKRIVREPTVNGYHQPVTLLPKRYDDNLMRLNSPVYLPKSPESNYDVTVSVMECPKSVMSPTTTTFRDCHDDSGRDSI